MKTRKVSVLRLTEVLTREGYSEAAIENLLNILNSISSKGYFRGQGVREDDKSIVMLVVGGTGLEPYFKLNAKSARIYLKTGDVRDCVIISHPTNWDRTREGFTADHITIGPRKYFQSNFTQRRDDSNIKKLSPYVVVV